MVHSVQEDCRKRWWCMELKEEEEEEEDSPNLIIHIQQNIPFNASRTHSCKHLQGCGSSSALIAATTGTRVTMKHRQEFFITSAGGEKIPISSLCRTLAVGQSGACVADNRVFVKGEVVA